MQARSARDLPMNHRFVAANWRLPLMSGRIAPFGATRLNPEVRKPKAGGSINGKPGFHAALNVFRFSEIGLRI
jgi:hypothetical protein